MLTKRITTVVTAAIPGLFIGLFLAACSGSPGSVAIERSPLTPPTDNSKTTCSIVEAGEPLNAAQQELMIAARQKVFGLDKVDPETGILPDDEVIFSWISVSGYAASLNGHVVLLDAFIGDQTGYVPLNDCELTDLRPEAVFIGHGHHDHARLLNTVVNRNRNIQVYATEEICIDLEIATTGLVEPNCHAVAAAGAPVGETSSFPGTLPNIDLEVIRLTHTAPAEPQDPSNPSIIIPAPIYPKPADAGPCFSGGESEDVPPNGFSCEPLTSPNSIPHNPTQDGAISVMYQFQMPHDLNIAWFNSFGPSEEGDAMRQAVDALPQTDIQLGSILGFNAFANGFRDARIAAELMQSRLSIPGHHDFFPGVRGRTFEAEFFNEMDNIPEATRPGLIFMSDPEHYILPERLTWKSDDPMWAETTPLEGYPQMSPLE